MGRCGAASGLREAREGSPEVQGFGHEAMVSDVSELRSAHPSGGAPPNPHTSWSIRPRRIQWVPQIGDSSSSSCTVALGRTHPLRSRGDRLRSRPIAERKGQNCKIRDRRSLDHGPGDGSSGSDRAPGPRRRRIIRPRPGRVRAAKTPTFGPRVRDNQDENAKSETEGLSATIPVTGLVPSE